MLVLGERVPTKCTNSSSPELSWFLSHQPSLHTIRHYTRQCLYIDRCEHLMHAVMVNSTSKRNMTLSIKNIRNNNTKDWTVAWYKSIQLFFMINRISILWYIFYFNSHYFFLHLINNIYWMHQLKRRSVSFIFLLRAS